MFDGTQAQVQTKHVLARARRATGYLFAAWSAVFAVRTAHARVAPQVPPPRKNVLGEPLKPCCTANKVGFYRDGSCHVGPDDAGRHAVCAVVTAEFLAFTRARGNDLTTPRPQHDFPGLKPNDRWCLCVARWQEALEAGLAPPVVLAATDEDTLRSLSLGLLRDHALKEP